MPGEEKIGEWTPTQLTRYVQQLLQDTDFLNAAKRTYDELTVTRKLTIGDERSSCRRRPVWGRLAVLRHCPLPPQVTFVFSTRWVSWSLSRTTHRARR
jgi:hypothetical protein